MSPQRRRICQLFLLALAAVSFAGCSAREHEEDRPAEGVSHDQEMLEHLRDLVFANEFKAAQAVLDEAPATPIWDYERGLLYDEIASYYATLHRFGLNVESVGYRSRALSSSGASRVFQAFCAYQLERPDQAARIVSRMDQEEVPEEFRGLVDALRVLTTDIDKHVGESSAQLLVRWFKGDQALALPDTTPTHSGTSLLDRWEPLLRAGILARRDPMQGANPVIVQIDLNEPVYVETMRVTGSEGDPQELNIEYFTAFPWLVLSHIYYTLGERAYTRVIESSALVFERTMAYYKRAVVRVAVGQYEDGMSDLMRFIERTGAGSVLGDDPEIAFIRPLAYGLMAECRVRAGEVPPSVDLPKRQSEVQKLAVEAEKIRVAVSSDTGVAKQDHYFDVADALADEHFRLLDDNDQRYYARTVDRLGELLLASPDTLLARTLEPVAHSVYRQSTNYDPSQNSLTFLLRLAHTYFVRGKVTHGQQVLASMDANDPERQRGGKSRFYAVLMQYQQASNSIVASRSNPRSGGNRD